MKKSLLFLISFAIGITVSAQSTLYYNFNSSLNEVNAAAPGLTVLGTQGNFFTDTLNEIAGSNKTVYRFEKNNGVQFNNVAAGNFLGETYTIELYFVFDELTSWKRVVDWKNRKTDKGAYVYYGELNFYNYIYSEEAPVRAGEYTYYVITRDAASKNVLIYTDAEVKINFTDSNNDAVIDEDGVLNFFYDDLAVPNEASSGAVALLKLYNYALDSTVIREKWEQLGSSVFGVNETAKSNVQVNVYPNPVTDILNLNLTAFTKQSEARIQVVNEIGQIMLAEKIIINSPSYSFAVNNFKKGLYTVVIETNGEVARSKFIVN
jgi:OmpA-OmpF porin, OOP family